VVAGLAFWVAGALRPAPAKPPPKMTPPTMTPPTMTPPTMTPPTMTPPTPPPPASGSGGGRFAKDAARYLCAAVQLDAGVNDELLTSIVGEPHRAVASSPGVDLVTVLKYAISAARRQVARNVALSLLLVGAVVGAGAAGNPVPMLVLFVIAWLLAFSERFVAQHRAAPDEGAVAEALRRAGRPDAHADSPAPGGAG
jgi:hypothetical protein